MEQPRISFKEVPQELYGTMINTEKYLRNCGIPFSLYELIKIRASQINGCGYCLDMHHKDALNAGESYDRLYLLPASQEAPCYTAEEKAVLHLTDVLTKIKDAQPEIIEKAYETMAKYYSKEEVAKIVLAICQINSWNRIAITFGTIPGSYQVKN